MFSTISGAGTRSAAATRSSIDQPPPLASHCSMHCRSGHMPFRFA